MATIASASSSTITSILSTVSTVAHTSQRSIQTLASGLDMLDTYVDTARKNQVAKHLVSNAMFLENLIQESTLEQARKEQSIAKELHSDQDLKTRYASVEARVRALFAEPVTQP